MSGGHGGRRAGAGRPSGSGWKPAIIKMRAVSAEQKAQIIGSDRDPMRFLVDMVWDESVDLQTRLSASAIVVPYLHPRLSATQVHNEDCGIGVADIYIFKAIQGASHVRRARRTTGRCRQTLCPPIDRADHKNAGGFR